MDPVFVSVLLYRAFQKCNNLVAHNAYINRDRIIVICNDICIRMMLDDKFAWL